MRILQPILYVLGLLALFALVAALAVLAPPVQTWAAREELGTLPGVGASLDSFSAGFGRVSVQNLKIEKEGAVLTLPSLDAKLPILRAVWRHQYRVESVVAKGWTLDLSGMAAAEAESEIETAPGTAAPAPESTTAQAERIIGGILGGWQIPVDGSLDGIELEGDVILAGAPGKDPVTVHVTVDGAGFAAGATGSADFKAYATSGAEMASADGTLKAALSPGRTFERISAQADVSADIGGGRDELTVAADAARTADGLTYGLDVGRSGRNALTLSAHSGGVGSRFDGTWKADLRKVDAAPFFIGHSLPEASAAGSGAFDADGDFSRVHLSGNLAGAFDGLGALHPALARVGAANWRSSFDVEIRGRVATASKLRVSISGSAPIAAAELGQPASLNLDSGAVAASVPEKELFSLELPGLPLSWLPVAPGGFSADGVLQGDFSAFCDNGVVTLRPRGPVRAGARILREGGEVAKNVGLVSTVTATLGAVSTDLAFKSLAVEIRGSRLAAGELNLSIPKGSEAAAYNGVLSFTTERLAKAVGPRFPAWASKSAAVEFKGSLGTTTDIEAKLTAVGAEGGKGLTATINADQDSTGAGEILAPLSFTEDGASTALNLEGSWSGSPGNRWVELSLTAETVPLDQVGVLLAPIVSLDGAGKARDTPAWGDFRGRLKFAFDTLKTGDGTYTAVGGTLEFDDKSVQLLGGHGEVGPKTLASADATVAFDPGAPEPYAVTGKVSVLAPLDASLLIPAAPGEDPVLEGRFTVSGTMTGSGKSLAELASRTQEVIMLSSTNGIIRLLKTDVADAVPETPERVSDTVDDAGNFIGHTLLGIKGHSIDLANNKVGKVAQSVIDFTNEASEIGFDKASVKVVRSAGGSLELRDIEVVSPDIRLTGGGTIANVRGKPLSQEPLALDLKVGVKDSAAKELTAAGLLSPSKDLLGFTLLKADAHFGGSIATIDAKSWHDQLAAAIPRKQPKAGEASR